MSSTRSLSSCAFVVSAVATAMLAVAVPAVAHAESSFTMPPGWKLDADLGGRIAADLQRWPHFGAPATAQASALVPPGGGGTLFVVQIAAGSVASIPAAVRAELDTVRGSRAALSIDASKTREDTWREQVVADQVVEANLRWSHLGDQTVTLTRALIHVTAAGPRMLLGECLMAADQVARLEPACAAALASMTVSTPVADRLAIAIGDVAAVPVVADPTATVVADDGSMEAPPPSTLSAREPPRLSEAPLGTPVMPPTVVGARRERDHRPLYVIGGLLVLVGVFLWNRSKRKAVDQASATARAGAGAAGVASDDDDAGDEDAGDDDADAAAMTDAARDDEAPASAAPVATTPSAAPTPPTPPDNQAPDREEPT